MDYIIHSIFSNALEGFFLLANWCSSYKDVNQEFQARFCLMKHHSYLVWNGSCKLFLWVLAILGKKGFTFSGHYKYMNKFFFSAWKWKKQIYQSHPGMACVVRHPILLVEAVAVRSLPDVVILLDASVGIEIKC